MLGVCVGYLHGGIKAWAGSTQGSRGPSWLGMEWVKRGKEQSGRVTPERSVMQLLLIPNPLLGDTSLVKAPARGNLADSS